MAHFYVEARHPVLAKCGSAGEVLLTHNATVSHEMSGWYAMRHCEESGRAMGVGMTKQSHPERR